MGLASVGVVAVVYIIADGGRFSKSDSAEAAVPQLARDRASPGAFHRVSVVVGGGSSRTAFGRAYRACRGAFPWVGTDPPRGGRYPPTAGRSLPGRGGRTARHAGRRASWPGTGSGAAVLSG